MKEILADMIQINKMFSYYYALYHFLQSQISDDPAITTSCVR